MLKAHQFLVLIKKQKRILVIIIYIIKKNPRSNEFLENCFLH